VTTDMEEAATTRCYSAGDHLRAMFRPEILLLVPIYCLGLIPATVLLAWLGIQADHALGLTSLAHWVPFSVRLGILLACLAVGGAWVGWVYTWLVLEGEGGPVPPFSSCTRRLVLEGPYAHMRHPSVWGKLLGVLGLGVFAGSPVFLFLEIPLLVVSSVSFTLRRQDVHMISVFGEEYLRYRDRTPRLIPKWPRRSFR
jgi:protein-S-isoprenylcysteine O-methyltransferase Ste14